MATRTSSAPSSGSTRPPSPRPPASSSARRPTTRPAPAGAASRERRQESSVGVAELDVDLDAFTAVRHVDAPQDVRADERADSDALRDLRARERLVEGAEDLSHGDERIGPPVGDHAEDVGLEEPDALLELEGPRLAIDEAVLREAAQDPGAAERALPVEGRAARADRRPREPGRTRDRVELRDDTPRLHARAQEGRRAREPLDHATPDVDAEAALGVVPASAVVVAQIEALPGEGGAPHPRRVREDAPAERQARHADGLHGVALNAHRDAQVQVPDEVHAPPRGRDRAQARVARLRAGRRVRAQAEEAEEDAALQAQQQLVRRGARGRRQPLPDEEVVVVGPRARRRDEREGGVLAGVVVPAEGAREPDDGVPAHARRDDRLRALALRADAQEHRHRSPGVALVGQRRVDGQRDELRGEAGAAIGRSAPRDEQRGGGDAGSDPRFQFAEPHFSRQRGAPFPYGPSLDDANPKGDPLTVEGHRRLRVPARPRRRRFAARQLAAPRRLRRENLLNPSRDVLNSLPSMPSGASNASGQLEPAATSLRALAREWLLPSRTLPRRAWPPAIGLAYIAAVGATRGGAASA